jgi:hypothetical protein
VPGATETGAVPAINIEAIEEDLDHVVCEIHDQVALCGTTFDFPGSEEYEDGEDPTCPLCEYAWEQGRRCGADRSCRGYRTRLDRFLHRITGGGRG